MSSKVIFSILIPGLLFFGCNDEVSKNREVKSSNLMKPYKMYGKWYYPKREIVGKKMVGIVSWYGDEFQGKLTASGEPFNMYDPTAAHKTLPMNTMLFVKNLDNGKSTIVRINDRGPFTKNRELLLSKRAGQEIDIIDRGIAKAEITILGYDGHIDQKILAKLQNEEREAKEEKEEKTKQIEKPEEQNSSKIAKTKIVPIVQGTFQGTEIIENPIFSAKKEDSIIEAVVSPSDEKENNISNSTDVEVLEVVEENISNSSFLNNKDIQDANSSTTENNSTDSNKSKIENDEVEEITNLVITPNKPKQNRYIKKYYVQVASFKSQDRAENFIIQKKDILPDGLSLQIRYEMGLYRIWVEGFQDSQEARKFNNEKKYFPSSFLVIRDEKVEQ